MIIEKKEPEERDLMRLMDVYPSVAEKSPVGIFIIQDQTFQWVNLKFEENTGYRASELIGMPSLSLVHPDDRGYVAASVRAILRGESIYPYE
ncbi:MAG: PAS domain-containing protein, partial [Smithellaceae bacterium]